MASPLDPVLGRMGWDDPDDVTDTRAYRGTWRPLRRFWLPSPYPSA